MGGVIPNPNITMVQIKLVIEVIAIKKGVNAM
jgi:hypothetical protein